MMPEKLVEFHFGRISPADREEVETHLRACPDCLGEYFLLKRDIEVDMAEQPSDLVRQRIRRDYAAYCRSLAEDGLAWAATHRLRIAAFVLAIAAALILIFYSGPLLKRSHEVPAPSPGTGRHELRSLDEAIDSGRLSPAHINTI